MAASEGTRSLTAVTVFFATDGRGRITAPAEVIRRAYGDG
jgi:hypothetical protein